MVQDDLNQDLETDAEDSQNLPGTIDLNELADKIVVLLLREISIETERTGR